MTTTETMIMAPPGHPAPNILVILRDESETMSEGGITLPKSSVQNKLTGTVVAAGEGTLRKPGERIQWGMDMHTDFNIDGVDYVVMPESKTCTHYEWVLPDTREVIPWQPLTNAL